MALKEFSLTPVYAARIFRNSAQSISSSTYIPLSFTTARRNDGLLWNPSTPTRLTAPVAAWYHPAAHIYWDTNTAGIRVMYLRRNGNPTAGTISVDERPASVRGQVVSADYYLEAGDYIEVMVWQNSGGMRVILYLPSYSPEFSMVHAT